jgi:hypothetical protein
MVTAGAVEPRQITLHPGWVIGPLAAAITTLLIVMVAQIAASTGPAAVTVALAAAAGWLVRAAASTPRLPLLAIATGAVLVSPWLLLGALTLIRRQ